MAIVGKAKLCGFFRPLYEGAGFAIPVFEESSKLYVQVIKSEVIAEFAECDVAVEELAKASNVQLVMGGRHCAFDSLSRSIGESAWYAFQLEADTVLLDGRVALDAVLNSTLGTLRLDENPFLSTDIAEFLGNDLKAAQERKRAHASLSIGRKTHHPRAPTKSEILAAISKETELSKNQIAAVFDSLSAVIKKSLRSHGVFTLPGLLKMKVVMKPATKAREGVNPFKGERMMFKAKPSSKQIRVLPSKHLNNEVSKERRRRLFR